MSDESRAGFVAIPRARMEAARALPYVQQLVLFYLAAEANYEPRAVVVNGVTILVETGELLFRKKKQATDPRFVPIRERLIEIYGAMKSPERYVFTGRDGKALKQLLAQQPQVTDSDVFTRWRAGLELTKFPGVSSVHQLFDRWNDLAAAAGEIQMLEETEAAAAREREEHERRERDTPDDARHWQKKVMDGDWERRKKAQRHT